MLPLASYRVHLSLVQNFELYVYVKIIKKKKTKEIFFGKKSPTVSPFYQTILIFCSVVVFLNTHILHGYSHSKHVLILYLAKNYDFL